MPKNKIEELEEKMNELEKKKVREKPDGDQLPEISLTDDKEINKQLIVYFWWLVVLTFLSQIIGYIVQYLSGTINVVVLGILVLGAVNTLIIGGGVKLVQKQMQSLSDQYNSKLKEKKRSDDRVSELERINQNLKSELNNRDAELIAIKTKEQKQNEQ